MEPVPGEITQMDLSPLKRTSTQKKLKKARKRAKVKPIQKRKRRPKKLRMKFNLCHKLKEETKKKKRRSLNQLRWKSLLMLL